MDHNQKGIKVTNVFIRRGNAGKENDVSKKGVIVTIGCGQSRYFIKENELQLIPHQMHNTQTLTLQAVDGTSHKKIPSYIKILPFDEGYQSLKINYDDVKHIWKIQAPGDSPNVAPKEPASNPLPVQVDVNIEIGEDND